MMFSVVFIRILWFSFVACDELKLPPENNNGKTLAYDTIIIGAGASGLQMGHHLSEIGADYVILERHTTAGSFFGQYPRHDTLLSINKYRTGVDHVEYNLRHDWNSILSPSLTSNHSLFRYNIDKQNAFRFSNYSHDYYPNRTALVSYLADYAQHFQLDIIYGANVDLIEKDKDKGFTLSVSLTKMAEHQRNEVKEHVTFVCKTLFIATGIFEPKIPANIPGIEHFIGYDSMPLDLAFYDNKKVAILGGRNSAFETAQYISQVTAVTHILVNKNPRFAFESHYVGDLRAINMEFIDHYLLKSMDAIGDELANKISAHYDTATNSYFLRSTDEDQEDQEEEDTSIMEMKMENKMHNKCAKNQSVAVATDKKSKISRNRPWPLRDAYDILIRCTGFQFDYSIFSDSIVAEIFNENNAKFPRMSNKYAARGVPGMYFIGAPMHAIDFKLGAGGFLHGYRYLLKALFSGLMTHNFATNKVLIEDVSEICRHLMMRINTASSFYQMFGFMSDFVMIARSTSRSTSTDPKTVTSKAKAKAVYFYDMLKYQINELKPTEPEAECVAILSLSFEYRDGFHSVAKVFRASSNERVHDDYKTAEKSNFLHPVLRHYECGVLEVTDAAMDDEALSFHELSQRHIIEDFLVKWDSDTFHAKWLAKWIDGILFNLDLDGGQVKQRTDFKINDFDEAFQKYYA